MGALRRWWRALWRRPAAAAPEATRPVPVAGSAGSGDDPARREPVRRRYTAQPLADDPQREAHLGAVLQALADGPLDRAALGRRVEADGWGPGRLDTVVDHGVATHVLVEGDDGTVRARYAD